MRSYAIAENQNNICVDVICSTMSYAIERAVEDNKNIYEIEWDGESAESISVIREC